MSYERILAGSRELEHLLGAAGATGHGLQTKIDSIEQQLDPVIVKRMRFVGAVRNSAFHDKNFSFDDDLLSRYEQAANACIQYMVKHLKTRQTQTEAQPGQPRTDRSSHDATSDNETPFKRARRFALTSAVLGFIAWYVS